MSQLRFQGIPSLRSVLLKSLEPLVSHHRQVSLLVLLLRLAPSELS